MGWTLLRKLFNFFASLELAVFLLLSLSAVLATGTIVESRHGLVLAQEMIYQSVWNQGLLWLLLINVTAAALSRLPWKRHHIGFLITHLGIIILLLGSFITSRLGVDGSLALAPGEAGRLLRVDQNYINIFRAVQGQSYELVYSEHTPWNSLRALKKTESYPLRASGAVLPLQLQVLQYYPRALRSVSVKETAGGVPAVQIRLKGSRAEIQELLFLQGKEGTTRELGPARVRLQRDKPGNAKVDKPTLYIVPREGQLPALYTAHPQRGLTALPFKKLGEFIPLGWMDFSLSVDKYYASAIPEVAYTPIPEGKTPALGSTPVETLEVALGGEKRWLELGASAQIAAQDAIYYVQYVKRHIDLGFDVRLKDFQVGYYPGTKRAMSYSSLVDVGGKETLISMNAPMQAAGFTFYQSSYDSDDSGRPTLSILSVNKDPGRWIKYSGSLMIVLGIVSMFYFKPQYSGRSRWLTGKPIERGSS